MSDEQDKGESSDNISNFNEFAQQRAPRTSRKSGFSVGGEEEPSKPYQWRYLDEEERAFQEAQGELMLCDLTYETQFGSTGVVAIAWVHPLDERFGAGCAILVTLPDGEMFQVATSPEQELVSCATVGEAMDMAEMRLSRRLSHLSDLRLF